MKIHDAFRKGGLEDSGIKIAFEVSQDNTDCASVFIKTLSSYGS